MIVKQDSDNGDIDDGDSDKPEVGSDLDLIEEQFACDICDQQFVDKETLLHHSKTHEVTQATSSFLLSLETNIYEQILAETPDIIDQTAELSESLLDSYDDLVDNLIASVSPDEILDKIVINNESPDNYSEIQAQNQRRREEREQAELNNDTDQFTKVVSKKENWKKRASEDSSEPSLIKKPKIVASPDKPALKEEFKGCASQKIEVKTGKIKFSLSIPEVINVKTLKDDLNVPLDPTLDKMFKTSLSRSKKFQDAEKTFDHRYRSYRRKFSKDTNTEELREMKKKSCKRGRLSYTVYSDLKNIACVRKNSRGLQRIQEDSSLEISQTESSEENEDSSVDDPDEVDDELEDERPERKPREKLSQSLVEVKSIQQLEEAESSQDLNFSMPILDF